MIRHALEVNKSRRNRLFIDRKYHTSGEIPVWRFIRRNIALVLRWRFSAVSLLLLFLGEIFLALWYW